MNRDEAAFIDLLISWNDAPNIESINAIYAGLAVWIRMPLTDAFSREFIYHPEFIDFINQFSRYRFEEKAVFWHKMVVYLDASDNPVQQNALFVEFEQFVKGFMTKNNDHRHDDLLGCGLEMLPASLSDRYLIKNIYLSKGHRQVV